MVRSRGMRYKLIMRIIITRNKKVFIALAVILIFLAIMLLVFVKPDPTNDEGKSTVQQTSNDRIVSGGTEINNPYRNAEVKSNGDAIVSNSTDYSIQYLSKFDEFLISIESSPFNVYRFLAEEELLETLDIDKKNACNLKVSITTPAFVNQEESGSVYKLSFCE